jgi:hypothetical protein
VTQEAFYKDLTYWLLGPDTGLSSKSMVMCALGFSPHIEFHPYHPSDAGDFWRCITLLRAVPAIRDFFPDIAQMSREWAALIGEWDELEALFIDEVGINCEKSVRASKTYQRIYKIYADCYRPERGEVTP